jgi:regulator of sirC expression with transglutaminase-like and TPR domain
MSGPVPATVIERFAALAEGPEEDLDLASGALLIAEAEYPDLDLSPYPARLDDMAADLQPRLARTAGPAEVAAALADYLFHEQGFHGNTESYYDPRNSFLNDVLDRRTGIPITLSAVYLEVARRAGLEAAGVGLPGHFLVRLHAKGGSLLVDPFHEGGVLTQADCQKRLDRIFEGRVQIEPRMLEAVGTRRILERMLRNLKVLYGKQEDHARALRVTDLLLALVPGSLDDLRDRGLLYAALDCYAFAVRDLEAYLSRAGALGRTRELESTLAVLQKRAARLN